MNLLKLRNEYTFDELLYLKSLVKYSDNLELALDLFMAGQTKYNTDHLSEMIDKFAENGLIVNFKAPLIGCEDDRYAAIFKKNYPNIILNTPNPIPDDLKECIDTISLLKKLPSSNLNSSENEYISLLIKKDVIG